MNLQKQLGDAHHKIEKQAPYNAKQEKKINDLSLVEKFLTVTDPRFLEYIAINSTWCLVSLLGPLLLYKLMSFGWKLV